MNKESLFIRDPIFQRIIDALPVLLFWTDKCHVYLGNNRPHAIAFGFQEPEDLIGISVADSFKQVGFDKAVEERVYKEHDRIIASKKGELLEYTGVLSDQKEYTYLSHKEPLFDNNGEVIGLIGISMDITELKITQQELIKAKLSTDQIFQSIIDALPVLLFWTDRNHTFLGNNKSHANSFGFSSTKKVVGMSMKGAAKLVGMDEIFLDRLYQEHAQIMGSREGQVLEYTGGLSDGQEYTYLSHKEPLLDENKDVIGLIGISMDITELKNTQKSLTEAKEKAEAASAAKSEFITNMSHDIRTPITGIIGMAQDLLNTAQNVKMTLADPKPAATSQKALAELLRKLAFTIEDDSDLLMSSADRLLQMCNEILETVRLDSGKAEPMDEAFDLHRIVQHNVDLLRPVAQHRQLSLSCDIDRTVPQYVEGLCTYLGRTLLNLISNALKFTEKGFVKISVDCLSDQKQSTRQLGDSVTVQICIEDSGIGIPEDKFEVVFEHFSRLTASYEGKYKGSGLGLYSVKCYVEAMKGSIDLQSTVGKGTTFTLTFPFLVSDHSDRIHQSIRMPLSLRNSPTPSLLSVKSEKKNSPSILVVEDNPAAAMAIKATLKPYDCAIDFARNGAMAVDMAKSGGYDLILMDVGLPDFSGVEATKKIRALPNVEKSQVPIVALTGHGDENARQECLEVGMQELLVKPAHPLALREILNQFVFECASEPVDAENVMDTSEDASLLVIDWEASLQRMGNNKEVVKELLSMCAEDLRTTKARLTKAIKQQDHKNLCDEVHRCLGGIVYLRLPQLEQALRDFQSIVKAGEAQDWLRVESAYTNLQTAIQTFLEASQEAVCHTPGD